ncbi:MAG: hypothetical protein OEZ10_05820 [Gammaproteobacteria bacterium]|nr:hypothetical protein [Gammaproteobacteria bacterium]
MRQQGLPVTAMLLTLCAQFASAGEADVVNAIATRQADGWQFRVTLKHDDAGWDHYANKWEVLSPDGKVLGTRVLLHPHVDEQPFTRGLSGVQVPAGTREVIIRAYDSVHADGGKEFRLKLVE